MKKLMTLMLGMMLVFGTTAVFAQDKSGDTKTEKKAGKKKGGKKKTDDDQERRRKVSSISLVVAGKPRSAGSPARQSSLPPFSPARYPPDSPVIL